MVKNLLHPRDVTILVRKKIYKDKIYFKKCHFLRNSSFKIHPYVC